MPQTALVTFTARPLREILHDGGSRDWRLDADRARRCEFLVCTQNRHNPEFRTPTAPHGSAFLIGHISEVVESPDRHDRWLVKISDYIPCNLLNIWGKRGHLRYPVWYTTLEELGIDLAALPPFGPLPEAGKDPRDASGHSELDDPAGTGMADRPVPLDNTTPFHPREHRAQDWDRLDAILRQLDRIPDLPEPLDPLDWDAHGLPR